MGQSSFNILNLVAPLMMMVEADYVPQGSIYKYTSAASAIATLQNCSFKFSCPLEFNDPFDCNTSILEFSKTKAGVADFKTALKEVDLPRTVKRTWLKGFDNPQMLRQIYDFVVHDKVSKSKVTCFSKRYANTLMWSHYADQHRGICLEFNGSMEPSAILERGVAMILNVNYERTDMINYTKNKAQAIVDLFTRKSKDWAYEEEVRIIVIDQSPFHRFNKDFLTGIIFGCRTSDQDKKSVLEILKDKQYDVTLHEAIRGKFELKFKPLNR